MGGSRLTPICWWCSLQDTSLYIYWCIHIAFHLYCVSLYRKSTVLHFSLHCTGLHYSTVVQCTTASWYCVQCSVLQHHDTVYSAMYYSIMIQCTVQCTTASWCSVQCSVLQHHVTVYSVVHCFTVLQCTAPASLHHWAANPSCFFPACSSPESYIRPVHPSQTQWCISYRPYVGHLRNIKGASLTNQILQISQTQ